MTATPQQQRIIFHVDMDAFFASVEQRDNPSYRGKPVIVGSPVGGRGVVSAASYEARRFGIHSAMPINQAYARCPQGVFVQPRMSAYHTASEEIMAIFAEFSPGIEQISVDEAFLDMSGTERLFGTPKQAASSIAERIANKLHLSASIGIAPNKFLAKIASACNKPNGITSCPFYPDAITAWLAPLTVEKLWGVGKKSADVLHSMGITTVADLQQLSQERLTDRFGKQGMALYFLCRGVDERPMELPSLPKSISREHTFEQDSRDRTVWHTTLLQLAEQVAQQARHQKLKGRTIFLTYRRPDFSRHTQRKTLLHPTSSAKTLFETVIELTHALREPALRLIGIGITNLNSSLQTELFGPDHQTENWERSEMATDALAERFGSTVIKKGAVIKQSNLLIKMN